MARRFKGQERMRAPVLGALFAAHAMLALPGAVAADLNWPRVPLSATVNARPMTMLIAGRDHKLFYEAYNDAGDVDGDGQIDIRYKPSITYYGLFDSGVCYAYSGDATTYDNTTTKNGELFTPVSAALDTVVGGKITVKGRCPGTGAGQWSGNWLNYLTTSRIDALRKVLYGGHREVDTNGTTVLRRAYIPQDSHSWGKEYRNVSTDGYDIRQYTPLDLPSSNRRRHFFGNLTANATVSCATLDDCSNLPPLLRVRTDVQDGRIWEWASKERPVLAGTLSTGDFPASTGAEQNFAVRVQVCTTAFDTDCKRYPGGATGGNLKPIGLLHEYGENDAMLFGLMTGSYDRHMTGARLRKVVASFADEIDATTGIFKAATATPIVTTFNRLRIRGFNQSGATSEYAFGNPYAASARAPTEGEFVDWGNPVGEMMYEALRYFGGAAAPKSGFDDASQRARDAEVGLSSAGWDDPYKTTSVARAPYCARPNFLVVSNINPSFDSDLVPGSVFGGTTEGLANLAGLNVSTSAQAITNQENKSVASAITGQRFFIGESPDGNSDAAPTPKAVSGLGNIRGLAPEEPTRQGSFHSAALAHWAKTNTIRRDLTDPKGNAVTRDVNVDSYVVALSSPLPSIAIPMGGRTVTLVPFAKSVGGSGIDPVKGRYQPTNQIVDFYVQELTPAQLANGGGYRAVFQINFEDVEQGGDHDMDAISRYTIEVNNQGVLQVTVDPTYQAGGIQQNMGFVISGVADSAGVSRDGVYLVARDETSSPAYFLNVPPGRWAGHCDVPSMPADCASLPGIGQTAHTFEFRASASATGARLLRDPLWYVAKYGGYVKEDDENSAGVGPTRTSEWDADGDGVPDAYFLVQNPLNLRTALRKALENISNSSGSGGNIIANSTRLEETTRVFQANFNSTRWSGDLLAYAANDAGVSATPSWNAAARLPKGSHTSRKVFYGSDAVAVNKGKEFLWGNLSPAERALFDNDQKVFNFVKGSGDDEVSQGGTFRDRGTSVLGDIAHSSPAYSKEGATVFVGSNGGMLHAFSTRPLGGANSTPPGSELFAYIPSAVMPQLKELTRINYSANHRYFVDGDIAVSPPLGTGKTVYLAGTLGRGGKGLFGLDVTRPENFQASDVKWEYFPTSDADLGFMMGQPVIGRTNAGTSVVLVGNGYNSTNGSAALYVFELATGTLLRKLVVPATGSNGLATPGLFSSGGDDAFEVAYAGDLFGQVWRFNLADPDPANWSVDNGATPIFTARDGSGKAQPITAPMAVAINSVSTDLNFNKRFVFFGTGSYFQTGDPVNTDRQSWYSIVDDAALPLVGGRADLRQRTIGVSEVFSYATDPNNPTGTAVSRKVRSVAASAAGDMGGKAGCFLDLPEAGERMVTRSNLYRLAEPTLIASSIVPETIDQCTPGGNGYVNAINPFTCARLGKPFFDLNDNGNFADDTLAGGAYAASVDLGVGMPGEAILIGNRLVQGGSSGRVEDIRVNTGALALRGRLSWREIVRD